MTLIELILFASAIYHFVLVSLILTKTHPRQSGRGIAWYILALAGWMLSAVIIIHPTTGRDTVILFARATFFFTTLSGISWIWFCADFPYASKRFYPVAWILTVLGVPWLYVAWTRALIESSTAYPWAQHCTDGPYKWPYLIWMVTIMAAGILHMAYKVSQTRGLERLQVRYILLGTSITVLIAGIVNLLLPALTGNTRYAPFGPLASVFITSSATYAIVRYRLMDIRIVLRAGLIYSITIGMLSLLFALLVPMLNTALTTRLHFPSTTGSFIMAFLIALAFQPVRRSIQHQVDRLFFKSVYDYRLTLREAGTALASARDREVLVATLVDALERTLRPSGVAVYLPGHGEIVTQIALSGHWSGLPLTLPESELVLQYAKETDEVMVVEEFIRQPEPQYSIGWRMQVWGAYVALPLIAGDRLCGMVFLGEKLSGDVYTSDDIGLLRILGKQAAIALDNARHYDEMVLTNEYHARLLHIMQDGVIAIDPDECIITFNSAAELITEVPASIAIGKRLTEINLTQLPTTDTGGLAMETTLCKLSGAEIPVLVTVTPFLRRWDVAQSYLIVFRDLSDLRALEQEKMQAECFSSMGAMAASLAHEIKNPLVPIKMFAHLLPSKYDDEEFRQEFSETVVNEVERINRLVGQMLDLVRKPATDRGNVDLREVASRLITLIQPECERTGITVNLEIDDDLPIITGVAGELYQAILNVLTNAVQAMPNGGELTVTLGMVDRQVFCRITDTGPGVPVEELPRIFEPLYTTKTSGHGLGLALTYQFVRSHGGDIRAECIPGSGLTITMLLPAGNSVEAESVC